MAFIRNTMSAHTIALGGGTLAETDVFLGALGLTPRAQLVGSTFEVAGDTVLNNGIWLITPTTRIKISNDAESGTMDSFDVTVGGVTATIGDGETLSFGGAGVVKATFDAATQTVSYAVDATSADAGKVVKIDGSGASVLADEAFLSATDSTTVDFTMTAGVLTAEVITDGTKGATKGAGGIETKLSTDSRQAAQFGTDGGVYVKDLVIGSASQARLSYDSTTNTLDMTALAVTSVVVDATSTDLAAGIIANSTLEEGDVLILTQTGEAWIHNNGTTGTIADWTLIEKPNITDAAIRALFSGVLGVTYNSATGQFKANIRAIDATHPNDLLLDADSMYVDVMAVMGNFGFGKQSLSKNLTDLFGMASTAFNRVYENGLTKTTVAGVQVVHLGGVLIEDTVIAATGKSMTYTASGAGIHKFDTNAVEIKNGFWVTNDNAERVFMRIGMFNNWYQDSTATYPN
jgi:hypothetical protein